MHNEYSDALLRLKEERERLGFTQADLCRKLYMTQGHYSKAESGKKRFTYVELKYLLNAGIDLHYVFTGEKISHPEYYDFFTGLAPREMCCLAETALPLVEYCLSQSPQKEAEDIPRRIKHIKCILTSNRREDSYYYQLRRYQAYSQQYMAEILGVDIKKYTSLEKQNRFGDSEVILNMYNNFLITPLLLLNDEAGLAREVCSLLEHLDEAECRKLFDCIKGMYDKLLR